jgi:hypothetical protein
VRIWKSLAVVGAIATATAAMAVAPALADPVNPHTGKAVTPNQWDIVGVGAQTSAFVSDALAYSYDKGIKKDTPSTPYVYEWDATPPSNPSFTGSQTITLKKGCTNIRPNGANPGITALTSYGITKYKGKKYPCVTFARSSRGRNSTTAPFDPACAKGGICFVKSAQDVVTYTTTRNSNVPDNLTKAQLVEIFGCTIPAAHGYAKGTWGALLGRKAKDPTARPDPLVPQTGAGTLKFWMETALGLPTDTEPSCSSLAGATKAADEPEENQGTSKYFLLKNGKPNPNVLFPFSVAAYVAQEAHSPAPGHKPKKGQNQFGVDETGVLYLDGIAGIAPTVKKAGEPVINPAWNNTVFRRYLYDVVPFASGKGVVNDIPANLVKIFGPKGYWCTHNSVLADYGFEATNLCGTSS